MRGPRAAFLLAALCACGGGAAAPTGTGPTPPVGDGVAHSGGDGIAAPAPKAERHLVAPIGNEPTVACDDHNEQTPEWRDPAPAKEGFVMVDAVAFRSGCLSASMLDEAFAAHEPALVRCFAQQRIQEASVVLRTTWDRTAGSPRLAKVDLRPAPGAALPAGAGPIAGCVQGALADLHDVGPEPTLPAVVDVLVRRGFPKEIETLGAD